MIDLYARPAPGSVSRSVMIDRAGRFRIARRDAELYSVMIVSSGSWGRAKIANAANRVLWLQPSTFTGSFVLNGGADGGIIVELSGSDDGMAPNLTVNWREADEDIV